MKSSVYYYVFEIKYRELVDLDAKSGLALYGAAEGLKRTYLATKQGTDCGVIGSQDASTCVLKVPAHNLCYLLGQVERLL